jgi:hypothetical protein
MGKRPLKEGGLRTEPHCFGDRHSGVNAEPSGGMGGGLDYASLISPATHH